ncbi:NAD(P)H-dependent glycerol-3-phosphate dehydrogenase [Methanococcus maripaludis]|uniref:Glycerol-3-phosphate dehydrogenase (NAD(P)+) n=1 Tax=Methanococcus maripaludis TaxID=39152 RepID=A0A7J9RXA9_METMI|nr:NAD(P)H-dependent glycerol-3-phosphate dehydrogenase [Methanococcus maripaludis]MBB6066835.1 glycerol-3-phosphate dehydrogenase (NAD(P)+) [Methanococcus maripaludis]
MKTVRNICIVGAGSFGTALGNVLSIDKNNVVTLIARNSDVATQISEYKLNNRYFPYVKLNDSLNATCDVTSISSADFLFLAVPSNSVLEYVKKNKDLISKNTIIVNLSKGFGENGNTIIGGLKNIVNNPLVSLKGPTFSMELINNVPSGFTCASKKTYFEEIGEIFKNTNVHLDFSDDIDGVELISSLKNIYAIYMGIVDAHFNSANVRFLALNQSFNELKKIMTLLGGKEETLYNYCGFGDFGLTALNDLSRNRTLGLMIGKGFFNRADHNSVILEGIRSVNIIYKKISKEKLSEFNILSSIYDLFNNNITTQEFSNRLLKKN